MECAFEIASESFTNGGLGNPAIEAKIMQTIHKFDGAHFIHLFYDASLLFFYVMSLILTVALGAYGLEMLFSAL